MREEIAIPRPPDRVSVPMPQFGTLADVILAVVVAFVAYRVKKKGLI